MVFETIYAFGIVFVVCELSERIITAFNEINDLTDQFDWYLFPIGIKKILPSIILNTQKSVTIDYFGSLSCSREGFKKVKNVKLLCLSSLLKLMI